MHYPNTALEHKTSLKSLGYSLFIAKNTLYGSKLLIFLLCQTSLGYYKDCMLHEDILYISNRKCKKLPTSVICIAKILIWTTIKAIVLQYFQFFCTLRFQIFKRSQQTVHRWKAFRYKSQFKKQMTLKTGFVEPGYYFGVI